MVVFSAQVQAFSIILFGNIAATYLQLKDADKAIKYAELGVQAAGAIIPHKLSLRLGKAYMLKGDLFK
jgi:hypothetical protein